MLQMYPKFSACIVSEARWAGPQREQAVTAPISWPGPFNLRGRISQPSDPKLTAHENPCGP
jgi:hypothetical protein